MRKRSRITSRLIRGSAAAAALAAGLAHGAWPAIQWQAGVQANPGFALESPLAARDAAGNVFVTAREVDATRSCILVAKYSAASGTPAWRRSLCDLDSAPRSIAADALGHVVVGGTARSPGGASSARIVKMDGADGRTHWERIFDMGAGSADEAAAGIAFDAARDVYVALTSASSVARLLKYSEGGTLRWQSEALAAAMSVRVDAQGNPFIAGLATLGAATQWTVMRFSPSTGQVAWRQSMGLGGSRPAAMEVDAAGNPLVTGVVPARATSDMRTVKYDGTSGAVLWQRDLLAPEDSAGLGIAIDPWGDVIVTGSAGSARETLAYGGRDGGIIWRRTHLPRGGRTASGASIAIDPAGNPIVAGEERPPPPSADFSIVTTALATESGDEIWSVPLDGPGGDTHRLGGALAVPGGVVVVGEVANRGELVIVKYGFAAVPAINAQALWWRAPAGSQSGWGVNVVHQGDVLFATWFTYDAQRRPLWMVMSEGVRTGVNEYAGTMYQVTGPPFDSPAWDPARVQVRAVGTGTFTFGDATGGTFRFMDAAGPAISHPITRQLFAAPVPTCTQGGEPSAANFTDLWWRAPPGSESGWGLNLVHQGDVIFATWFTYGADGAPLWLVASEMRATAAGSFAGDLFRTSGPGFGALPWDPESVTRTKVGSATLDFSGPAAGTFGYTVDGVTGSKPITRQVFAAPQSACR